MSIFDLDSPQSFTKAIPKSRHIRLPQVDGEIRYIDWGVRFEATTLHLIKVSDIPCGEGQYSETGRDYLFASQDIGKVVVIDYSIKDISARVRPRTPTFTLEEAAEDLFEFLKHGDEAHQRWLRERCLKWAHRFFEGRLGTEGETVQ